LRLNLRHLLFHFLQFAAPMAFRASAISIKFGIPAIVLQNSAMKAILLDIEGTTTPIDFVHKTLFPFAKENVGMFLSENLNEIAEEITQLKSEYKLDFQNQIYGKKFVENSAESVGDYLKFLIDVDRKSTPLKSLQGKIWQQGYQSGELQSVMFEDVPRAFERWYSQGKTIAIYSSGSILAQKLIFRYSNFGDLSKYISVYFDTNIGGKREIESYRKIAKKMNTNPHEIMFVSDVLQELDAAYEADFATLLSIRAGNGIVHQPINHNAIASFLDFEVE
jgi:enolase-phosphatase E1